MQLELMPGDGIDGDRACGANRLTHWAPQQWAVAADWQPVVTRFLSSQAGHQLGQFVCSRIEAGATIYPRDPFYALRLTPLKLVTVVILGQDPYHRPGQAQGLAFSVAPGVRPPPSLRNILTEVNRDRGTGADRVTEQVPEAVVGTAVGAVAGVGVGSIDSRVDVPVDGSSPGSLERWAGQGVLLLNSCLTVEQGRPGSHANHGWEVLTDNLIESVITSGNPVVFMLWGTHAQAKVRLLGAARTGSNNLVLIANHPSPLSARRPPLPFSGCGHFSLANTFLRQHGLDPVRW